MVAIARKIESTYKQTDKQINKQIKNVTTVLINFVKFAIKSRQTYLYLQ